MDPTEMSTQRPPGLVFSGRDQARHYIMTFVLEIIAACSFALGFLFKSRILAIPAFMVLLGVLVYTRYLAFHMVGASLRRRANSEFEVYARAEAVSALLLFGAYFKRALVERKLPE